MESRVEKGINKRGKDERYGQKGEGDEGREEGEREGEMKRKGG